MKGKCNTPQQYMNFYMAAQELAKYPEYQNDFNFQYDVCKKYGVFLNCITDDEADFLSQLVEEYYERS